MSNKYRKEILIEKMEWIELNYWAGGGKTYKFPKADYPSIERKVR